MSAKSATKSAPVSAPKSAPAPEVTLYSVAQSDAMERFRKSAVAVKSAALECVRFACAMIDAGVHTVRNEEAITTILSLAKVHTDTSTAYYIRDLASARLAAPAAFETIAAKSLDAVRAIATRTDGDADLVRSNLESVAQAIKADPKLTAKDALAKSALLKPTKSERKAAESRPTGTDLKARLAKCAFDGCSGNYNAAIESLKAAIEQLERESAHAARIAKSA